MQEDFSSASPKELAPPSLSSAFLQGPSLNEIENCLAGLSAEEMEQVLTMAMAILMFLTKYIITFDHVKEGDENRIINMTMFYFVWD